MRELKPTHLGNNKINPMLTHISFRTSYQFLRKLIITNFFYFINNATLKYKPIYEKVNSEIFEKIEYPTILQLIIIQKALH